MSRARLAWLGAAAVLAVVVAVQTVISTTGPSMLVAGADLPTVTAGVDVLAGVPVVPVRVRHGDYRRAAFGEAWTDDTDAPGGHNLCDTRNDILDRDLIDKTCNRVVLTRIEELRQHAIDDDLCNGQTELIARNIAKLECLVDRHIFRQSYEHKS